MNITELKPYIEWDIATWSKALNYWQTIIEGKKPKLDYGLEVGANKGGLSLFFSRVYNSQIICSDYKFPDTAREIHQTYSLTTIPQYQQVDATKMTFEDDTFDFVVFKSVLGGIGHHKGYSGIQKCLSEIHRVLKPNGILFFAENAKGSYLHQLARAVYRRDGWRFIALQEFESLLQIFSEKKLNLTGFSAAFAPNQEKLKKTLSQFDDYSSDFVPQNWKYVAYGYAIK